MAALSCLLSPVSLTAQDFQRGISVSLSAVTIHGLGVGIDVGVTRRLQIAARAEGPSRKRALGIGPRLEILSQRDVGISALTLVGRTYCRPQGEVACPDGPGSAASIAAALGIEFKIARRWSNTLELTRWQPLRESDIETDYDEPRNTIALRVRYFL